MNTSTLLRRLLTALSILALGAVLQPAAAQPQATQAGGSEIRLGINPDYMSQFLSAVETEKVLFELKDENTQAIGFPVEGNDRRYLCVIMPMRI